MKNEEGYLIVWVFLLIPRGYFEAKKFLFMRQGTNIRRPFFMRHETRFSRATFFNRVTIT